MQNIEDFQKLTPAQQAAMNRALGKKVLTHFAIIFGIKWALIIGINRWARKLRNDSKNS